MESSSVQRKQNEEEKEGKKIKGELKNGKATPLSTGW